MAKKSTVQKTVLRKAVMKKSKSFKFGQALKKDEQVLIKETFANRGRIIFTAFRPDDPQFGFVVTRSEFEFTEKEKFVVCVSRISYASRNIEVEAMDRKDAERIATEEAGNYEFSEHDAEYKSDGVFTKTEHENLF